MAILKDLIVHGSSRFLNKIYASEIQTPLIEAEAGVFKKLKADDATVVGLLDVKGQLHTNSWSNSNIATIDGSFYITPTIGSASGTVTITASSLVFSGTNYAVSSLYLGDGSSITWPQYSKVLITGQILSNEEWIPLGTLLGQLSSTATAASISINNIKDNKNQTSNILATLVNEGTTSSNYRNLKVSLYQRASSSTAFYPLGIYMTATGTNGRTFLDIYGGVEALSNSNNYGGFAEPNVRIGNLQGLPNVGGQTPSGWGIYTDNGYFKGIIAADKGFIGSGSKYWVIANEEDVSNVENSRSYIYNGTDNINSNTPGVYLGTDGIRNYKDSTHFVKINQGIIEAYGVKLSGQITATSGSIAGWTIKNSYLASNNATAPGDNILILSPKGTTKSYIVGGSESISGWVLTAGANFGVTKSGALYANSANISGKVVATSGSIGGVNIVDGNLDVSSINIGDLSGEIGGRNIIWNSNFHLPIDGTWNDWGSPTTREIVTINGENWMHIVTTANAFQGYSQNQANRNGFGEIQAGEQIIFSFDAYSKVDGQKACIGIHWRNSNDTNLNQDWTSFDLTTTKKRYVTKAFTVPNNVVGFNIMVGQSVATAQELWITNIKGEKGNKATAWTPAPEDINDAINNIEIGGRNLIRNTATMPTAKVDGYNFRASGGTVTHVDISSPPINGITGAIRVTNNGSSAARIGMTQDSLKNCFIAGEKYTMSCWVRASVTLEVMFQIIWASGERTTGNSSTILGYNFNVGTDWTYLKWEGATLLGTQVSQYSSGYVYGLNVPVNGWIEVCGLKVEKGNKATAWTPAPEDTQGSINNVSTVANAINLSPYFSYSPYVVNNYWKNFNDHNGYTFTNMGDGWVRIQYTNTGSSVVRRDFTPKFNREIKEGTDYTWLIEFRNNNSTGTSTGTDFYLVEANNCQFWGGAIKENIEGSGTGSSTFPISYVPTGTSEIYKKRFIKTSEATGSTHWTDGSADNLIGLACFTARCAANTTIDYEVRISVYEGRYLGDYKPYIDSSAGNVANIALNQSVEYIIGTQTAATGSWTGKTNDSSLIAGKTIAYKLPYAGSGNASLNLTLANGTTTGAKAVYLNTTRVTTHFGAGSVIQMTYNGTDWRVTSIPNTNTIGTFGATKLIAGTNVSNASATTVYRYTLIMKKTIGNSPTWVSLVTSSGTGTSKTRYTGGLYPDKVFYMSTNVSSSPYGYNTGASTGDSYAALGFDLRYSTNCGSTLVIGKPVYLVGTINSLDGLFYLDSTWWTQTEPTIEDGKTYIYLGNAYSTTNVYLVEENPLMRYYQGAFRTEEEIAGMTATSYITYVNANDGIKIHNANDLIDYIQINSDAISMYRRDTQQLQTSIETLRIQSDNIRIGKIGTGKRNVFITDSAVLIRNNTTTLASYGDSIVLGNEDSLSQITLSQTGVVFTPKTIANSTESAGTFKYIVNESGHSYTLIEEPASNQSTGTATKDPLRLNNNTYYSNTESFSDVILAKVNNEFWVLGKTGETETSTVVQSVGTDSETWNYNSTPVTKTTITYATMEEVQETTVEREDGSEETESVVVQVNYQITKVESWEKWSVTSGTISGNYIYSGYIKKDPSDETNQSLYSVSYQRKISTSQSSTGTTLNVNVSTDITTSLSFRQMTDFYENKNFDYVTTEPDFSILFGKDVWTNSPYSYILGGEKNVIKTNSTIPALYSTIVGGYQNGYFYNKHANTPSLEDTLYKMGIECFIGNGYGNSVQSNLSSIVGGQYNAIYDGESFSVIGGGYNNSIQTWYDDAIPNNTNFYNAPYQFLGGGKDNSSRSDYGVLVGGYNNTNLGKYSVISGGAFNKTVGQYSVIAGGNNNTVLGENSYAHGYLNIAQGNNQTVFGKANIPDSTSLFIIGNGIDNSNRSNALTVNQSGDLTIARNLNLHSDTTIILAQKEDYPVYPDSAPKTNRIYASRWADTMNNYYHVQGYHAFYANGNGTFYIEPSRVISMVPFYAPNHLEWITNTNNISRENVIYYGTPKTSVYPSATANQPVTNGWFYYKQFAGQSTYNIILGSHMNTQNPTLYIRSKYRSGSTYQWSNWVQFITSSYSALTITRKVTTTYITNDDFARMKAYKKNGMLYLNFNVLFNGSSDLAANTSHTIATISGWNAISDAYAQIPCQNDSTKILTLTVTSTGTVQAYSTKAIHGWYRASICVPYNT